MRTSEGRASQALRTVSAKALGKTVCACGSRSEETREGAEWAEAG
jgi:hypothetical protein